MSYIDNIASALLNVHLFEMAHQRKNIVDRLASLDSQIGYHIIKIALHPEHSARQHWESEINAWLSSINTMRYDRNKKLKFDDYYKNLYLKPFEHTEFVNMVAKGISKVDDLPDLKWSAAHKQDLENKIKAVYNDICKRLADDDYQHIRYILKDHGI